MRVRIAPSPTGFFHIGNAKTALVNWLMARQQGGTFILRLEDTDTERSEEQYTQIIFDALQWLGIEWDEGPDPKGGPDRGAHGPYRQSQRREQHTEAAERLMAEGKAYRCYCTKEELDAERERARAEKRPPRYSGICRNLSPDESDGRKSERHVIRFKVEPGETVINDIVQGTVRTNNKEFDDFVLIKPNGDPIFHLAVVVDDGLMEITHVIRGDDHLTNAARHVMLFEALGFKVPIFGHLPMVLDEKGSKYSKRLHGANVLDWREDGYLPETIVNYLVLLGWTPGDDRELFTPSELVEAFSANRLGKSAAKFDFKKLQWLNGQHIRRLAPEDLRDRVIPILSEAGFDTMSKDPEWLTQMASICQEKIPTLNDIVEYTDFFFVPPTDYEEKAVRKQWRDDGAAELMSALRDIFASAEPWSLDRLKEEFQSLAETRELSLGKLVHPTRLALTGKSIGPGLFELAELLGREACVARMDAGIAYIESLGDE